MSALCDLVVATDDDVRAILSAPVPSQVFDGIDIKGIGPVKLVMLHTMLSGRTFEKLLSEYDPVAQTSEEGPWVLRLPNDLVQPLAQMSKEDRVLTDSHWAETEEFVLDSWDPAEVQRTLSAIYETEGLAKSSGHGLYLWMSL
jgi:hypothetical protein